MLVLKQVGELINIDVGLAGSVVVENAKPLKIHLDTMLRRTQKDNRKCFV